MLHTIDKLVITRIIDQPSEPCTLCAGTVSRLPYQVNTKIIEGMWSSIKCSETLSKNVHDRLFSHLLVSPRLHLAVLGVRGGCLSRSCGRVPLHRRRHHYHSLRSPQ
ncbi:hypothetical protein KC363_g244 [Hortaea werneckii]|nr:hypothetical protein KC363_g244 [Hortaea werneckii]